MRNISEFSPKKFPLISPLRFFRKSFKKSRGGGGVNFHPSPPLWDFLQKIFSSLHPYIPLVKLWLFGFSICTMSSLFLFYCSGLFYLKNELDLIENFVKFYSPEEWILNKNRLYLYVWNDYNFFKIFNKNFSLVS